jgi:hypothetical protein
MRKASAIAWREGGLGGGGSMNAEKGVGPPSQERFWEGFWVIVVLVAKNGGCFLQMLDPFALAHQNQEGGRAKKT